MKGIPAAMDKLGVKRTTKQQRVVMIRCITTTIKTNVLSNVNTVNKIYQYPRQTPAGPEPASPRRAGSDPQPNGFGGSATMSIHIRITMNYKDAYTYTELQ